MDYRSVDAFLRSSNFYYGSNALGLCVLPRRPRPHVRGTLGGFSPWSDVKSVFSSVGNFFAQDLRRHRRFLQQHLSRGARFERRRRAADTAVTSSNTFFDTAGATAHQHLTVTKILAAAKRFAQAVSSYEREATSQASVTRQLDKVRRWRMFINAASDAFSNAEGALAVERLSGIQTLYQAHRQTDSWRP